MAGPTFKGDRFVRMMRRAIAADDAALACGAPGGALRRRRDRRAATLRDYEAGGLARRSANLDRPVGAVRLRAGSRARATHPLGGGTGTA